jgi:hypothetical protein
MANALDTLFGPLGKEYCLYFYILSVIGFVFFFITFLSILFLGISKRKGVDYFLPAVFGTLPWVIFYLQNRILNTMCVHSM